MNRYSYNTYLQIHRRYYSLCPKCQFLHWDELAKCPKPTQASIDLRDGRRRDLEVIPQAEWDAGRRDFRYTDGTPALLGNTPDYVIIDE